MRWALTMIRLEAAWRKTSLCGRDGAGCDHVGKHPTRPDGWQLINVADEQETHPQPFMMAFIVKLRGANPVVDDEEEPRW
jgi:hypothetical protein